MVKVSIVVPVYNVEKYLRRCLDSLVKQSLEDIEIIVVNDGSPDNSQNIIDEYVLKYPQKVMALNKNNGGLSDARNFGIPYCTGEYIGFVDSDDYVDPKMYESLYKMAKDNNSDIVMCDYYQEYRNYRKRICVDSVGEPKQVFTCMLAAAWNKIYRRDLIMNTGVRFPVGLYYEDTAFFSMLIPYVNRIDTLNEPFVHYVQREGSIANTQGQRTSQIFDIFDVIIGDFKTKEIMDEYYEEVEYLCAKVLLGSSLKRMSGIDDPKLRSRYGKQTIQYLNRNFPKWKRNSIIKKSKFNYRHLFMVSLNGITIVPIINFMHFVALHSKDGLK